MTSHVVDWAGPARLDLDAIATYIAADSVVNALKGVGRIEDRAACLASFPDRGRIVPELRAHGIMGFREVIERPWRLIYQIEDRRVVVVSVLDGRRDLEALLLDRFVR